MKLKFKHNQKIHIYRFPNSREIYFSNILGMNDNFLVIARPYIEIGDSFIYMDKINPNSLIYGDFENNGKIYYFRTNVLKSGYTPFPHLFLKKPDERNIKIRNLRKFERYYSFLTASINFVEKGIEIKELDVLIFNVSLSGISVVTHINPPDIFNIELKLFEESVNITAEKKVFQERRFGNFNFVGCEIKKVDKLNLYNKYIDLVSIVNEEIL